MEPNDSCLDKLPAIVTAGLIANAIVSSNDCDLLTELSAEEMLCAESVAVRRLGLRLQHIAGRLDTNKCIRIISSDPSAEIVSAAFGYLGELGSSNSDPTLVKLCESFVRDLQICEVVRVAAYKAYLYVVGRTLEHPKCMFEIKTIDDFRWELMGSECEK
jgi:hypothetical protein